MVNKKRGLGKGLSALIPNEPIDNIIDKGNESEHVIYIDISRIGPNKNQPRKEFDEQSLNELAQSIKQYGVIQPIMVRKIDNYYEIIVGERRWKASKKAGLKKIPCIIKNIKSLEATKLALIENIQREDLDAIEEAIAFKNLMSEYKFTQEDIAEIIGKSRSYVANSIRLLNLDKKIISDIKKGKISSGHGRALLSVDDKQKQLQIENNIVENNMNVRDTEKLVKKFSNGLKSKSEIKKIKTHSNDYFLVELEEKLMRILGTKVQIISGKKKGKIQIEYYGEEDLSRIIDILNN